MTPGFVECVLYQIEYRVRPAGDTSQVTGCIGPMTYGHVHQIIDR